MFLQKYTGHKMCGLNSGDLWCSGMAGFCNTLKIIFPRPDQNTPTLQCLHQGVKLVWLCVNKAGSDLILNRYSWCNLNRFRKFYRMLDAIPTTHQLFLALMCLSVRPSVRWSALNEQAHTALIIHRAIRHVIIIYSSRWKEKCFYHELASL